MKLHEIILVPDQDEQQLKSYVKHITDEQEIGKSENFTMLEGQLDGKIAYVGRLDDGTFIGYIAGQKFKLSGKVFFQSQYTYVADEFKKKGFATAMYMYIVRTLQIPIISDESQTKYAKMLWATFINKNMVQAYDSEQKKFVAVNDVDPDELYAGISKGDVGKRYHLAMEESRPMKIKSPSKLIHERAIYTVVNSGYE